MARIITVDQRPLDRRALALTVALGFGQDTVYALVFLSYMNHYLLDVLHTSPGLPGYTLALYGSTKLIVHPLAGRLLDRTSPRLVYAGALAVQLSGIALFLLVHTMAAFLAGACLMAIGSASTWPLIYDVMARTQAPEQRGAAVGVLAMSGYVGVAAGFGSGVLLANFAPWRAAFVLAAAVVGAPALFIRSRALRAGRRESQGEREEQPADFRHLALFGFIIFLDYSAVSSLAGVYGPYVRLSLGITLLHATLIMIPSGLVAVVALWVSSRVTRPRRRPRELSVLFVLCAAGAGALSLTSSPWVAAFVALPLAAGAAGTGAIVAAAMIDFGAAGQRGVIFGTLMSVEGVGSVTGPALVGGVTDLFNPQAGIAAVGAIYGFLVLVTLFAASRFGPRHGAGVSAAPAANNPANG